MKPDPNHDNFQPGEITLELIERLEDSDIINEDLGRNRTLSVWRHRTSRGAKVHYIVRLTQGDMELAQRGAFLPVRALAHVKRFRRMCGR